MTQYPFKPKLQGCLLSSDLTPTSNDIICGRGKMYSKHSGNNQFSQTVRENVQRYVDAQKRIEKSLVVSSVAQRMQDDGHRFIKQKDGPTRQWFELSKEAIHDKIGHAIRDLLKNLKSQGAEIKPIKKSRKRRCGVSSQNKCVAASSQRPSSRNSDDQEKEEEEVSSTPDWATISFCARQMEFARKLDFQPIGADEVVSAVLGISDNMSGNDASLMMSAEALLSPGPVFSDPILSSELLDALSDNDTGAARKIPGERNGKRRIHPHHQNGASTKRKGASSLVPLPIAAEPNLERRDIDIMLDLLSG